MTARGAQMDLRGWRAIAARALIFGLFAVFLPRLAFAAEPVLEISAAGETRAFTPAELLARPDAATIEVLKDVTRTPPNT